MEFMVIRTSTLSEDGPPCPEAYQKDYTRIDERTFKSFDEYKNRLKEDFLADGTNHRILPNGYIARDFADKEWFIQLNNLSDLLLFQAKYGDIILTQSMWNSEIMEIEIYDGYRE
jgi:hypothetical protein